MGPKGLAGARSDPASAQAGGSARRGEPGPEGPGPDEVVPVRTRGALEEERDLAVAALARLDEE
ncbi:MAG: hypothetical protein ACRDYD_01520, partial [Acidimicrobiales bacterium]